MYRTPSSRVLLVLSPLLVLQSMARLADNPYTEGADYDMITLAKNAEKQHCAGGFNGNLDREEAKKDLKGGAGEGDNDVIRNVLVKANNPDELGKVAEQEITPGFLIAKAAPLIMSFVMFFIWLICCWTICPCCRCCRCCKAERQTGRIVKFIVLICASLLVLSTVIVGLVANLGYNNSRAGFDNLECTSATMLSTTLAGDDKFVGLVPLLESFWLIQGNLTDGAPFMKSISSLLDSTVEIEDAVAMSSGTLALLRDMMENPANTAPRSATGADLKHRCDFCTQLAPTLTAAIKVMDDSVGTALKNARGEVDAQLQGSAKQQLVKDMQEGTKSLRNVKKTIRETLSFFVEPEKFKQVNNIVDGPVWYAVISITFIAFLVAIFAVKAIFTFIFCERSKVYEEQGKNPYVRSVSRIAGCTWCCGFLLTFVAFFVGGLLVILSVPLSSMCLLMIDMDRALLTDISPALGQTVNESDMDFQGYLNIVENCLTTTNQSAPVNLLDQVYVENESSTQWMTIRQKIEAEVALKVDGQFDKLAATMDTTGASLATQAQMVKLQHILGNTSIDSMYLPVRTLKDDPIFQPMALNADVAKGFATSISCTDEKVSADLDKSAPTIQGVTKFANSLVAAGGTAIPSLSCAKTVTCGAANSANDRACNAGNELMKLKLQLRQLSTYRCDLFVDANGIECDPMDMSLNAGKTCLSKDVTGKKTLRRKERKCTITEYRKYVTDFSVRIRNSLQAVDVAVPKTSAKIAKDLKTAVKTYITGPIMNVVAGVTCNFIGTAYQGMIDGLCLQGVVGFRMIGNSYVACAFLTIITIIIAYGVWRRSHDNVHQWAHNHPQGAQLAQTSQAPTV